IRAVSSRASSFVIRPEPVSAATVSACMPTVAALGAAVSGATYIKVGLYGCTTPEQAIEVMSGVVRAVKEYRPDAFVVASGYADAHRIGCVSPLALPDIARRSGSDAAMLDTAIKDGTRLFDHVSPAACAEFVRLAHEAGLLAALAGSVKAEDLATLTRIGTDIVGVRGAVCEGGDRNAGRIQPRLVAAFRAEMDRHAQEHATTVAAL
ncbi:(5-formylfuran-3-yl)methyl phosphate synthase, partial [Streptomyces cyaneofuscatus]